VNALQPLLCKLNGLVEHWLTVTVSVTDGELQMLHC